MTPSRIRKLLVRSTRLAAVLLVLMACIWVARWFAIDAVRLPDASPAAQSAGVSATNELPGPERSRPPAAPSSAETLIQAIETFAATNRASASAPASGAAGLFDSLASPAPADPDVPLPDGVTRLYAQAGRDGSGDRLAIYRTAGSMSAVVATIEQRMAAAGWRREGRPAADTHHSQADAAPPRWFARYLRGDRTCLMMVAPDARRDENLLVVRTLRTPLETP